jgi:hypothetical protein
VFRTLHAAAGSTQDGFGIQAICRSSSRPAFVSPGSIASTHQGPAHVDGKLQHHIQHVACCCAQENPIYLASKSDAAGKGAGGKDAGKAGRKK